jgi:hypothetical protein
MAIDIASAYNGAANQIAAMQGIAQANNAASAEQARIQRDWQEVQNAKAMEFNANEAAKNRDWQAMMSNTAHQREMKDLMAAGLNPVLSAMNGNGAAVTSGATAQGVTSQGAKGETDTSTNGAIANLLGSILSAQTQLQAANINARTQEAVADKYTAMEQIVASIAASASRYGADMNYNIHRDFPSNIYQFGGSLLSGLSGSGGKKGSGVVTNAKNAVESGFDKLFKSVDDNDGYALITKLFPGLKKFDFMKVK